MPKTTKSLLALLPSEGKSDEEIVAAALAVLEEKGIPISQETKEAIEEATEVDLPDTTKKST